MTLSDYIAIGMLTAYAIGGTLAVLGLLESNRTPAPDIAKLRARYTAALSRGDTRGQKRALVDLQAAVNAQLRREVGK